MKIPPKITYYNFLLSGRDTAAEAETGESGEREERAKTQQ